jgi:hypothetical protein
MVKNYKCIVNCLRRSGAPPAAIRKYNKLISVAKTLKNLELVTAYLISTYKTELGGDIEVMLAARSELVFDDLNLQNATENIFYKLDHLNSRETTNNVYNDAPSNIQAAIRQINNTIPSKWGSRTSWDGGHVVAFYNPSPSINGNTTLKDDLYEAGYGRLKWKINKNTSLSVYSWWGWVVDAAEDVGDYLTDPSSYACVVLGLGVGIACAEYSDDVYAVGDCEEDFTMCDSCICNTTK